MITIDTVEQLFDAWICHFYERPESEFSSKKIKEKVRSAKRILGTRSDPVLRASKASAIASQASIHKLVSRYIHDGAKRSSLEKDVEHLKLAASWATLSRQCAIVSAKKSCGE